MQRGFLLFLLLLSGNLFSQNIAIGQWRAHLDYSNGVQIAEVGDTVFCGTGTGLFYYDRLYNTTVGMSKVNGLTDINIRTIKYHPKYQTLFIGYVSTGIDLLRFSKVTTINDINRYPGIIGDKVLNSFDFLGKYCYISTTFGIVKYDIERGYVEEDYREIFPVDGSQLNVSEVVFLRDSLFAATNKGIISASLASNVNLRDFNNWHLVLKGNCVALDTFQGTLWAGMNDEVKKTTKLNELTPTGWKVFEDVSIFNIGSIETYRGKLQVHSRNDGSQSGRLVTIDGSRSVKYKEDNVNYFLVGRDGQYWTAQGTYGMRSVNEKGDNFFYKPNGPATQANSHIHNYKDEIWVSAGGLKPDHGQFYSLAGAHVFKSGTWSKKNDQTVRAWPQPPNYFFDVFLIAGDVANSKLYLASVSSGLMELDPATESINIFDKSNSIITHRFGADPTELAKLTGLAFDSENNLWLSNYLAPRPLLVKKAKGGFKNFDVGSSSSMKDLMALAVDDYNNIWAVKQDKGMGVFSYGKSIDDERDDQYKELSTGKGAGNLPNDKVNCLVKDRTGQIWIGTNSGVAAFYDPSLVFTRQNSDAQQPFVEDGKSSGPLLGGEIVTVMAVDGANQKWIGTRNGLWITNADGTKILKNFNTKNSPLPSNTITSIGIMGNTGEVFIGTNLGIMSYRDVATEPNTSLTNVYAFPNPVEPNYEGPIAITGLVESTSVKITDITGKIVYETISKGGTATWDGKNFSGVKASTGVYLVFLSNADGSDALVTKIMFIR